MEQSELKAFLDKKFREYNKPAFIHNDPVSVPHRFKKRQDIEITGLWTAVLSWGQRITIINKSLQLFSLMDNSPFDFIANHSEKDLLRLLKFRHRTFNTTDTLYFIHFFQSWYSKHDSLEGLFCPDKNDATIESGLNRFHRQFFSLPEAPSRTHKHIPSPAMGSACKRLNMFLRWMVRKDDAGIDFGIWNRISASQLICPCDIHVERVARKLGLITRKKADWKTAVELTANLRKLDPADPVKYDYALFGLGINEKY
jgi:uncharacterized protein (TIGR02757 family)